MKKILLALLVSTLSFTAFAQDLEGSVKGLADARQAQIEIDFSSASIHGLSEEGFAAIEADWYKDKPEIIGDFVTPAVDKLKDVLSLGVNTGCTYKIVIKVVSINKSGTWRSDAVIYNGDTQEATIKDIKGKGGTFGSQLNLIKDGAQSSGQKFAAALKKYLKKAKK